MSPLPICLEPEEPEKEEPPPEKQIKHIWFEDSELRRLHGEQTKAGLVRARERGKQLGRPRVNERFEFVQRFVDIAARLAKGEISRHQAAKELDICDGTLKRLLDDKAEREREALSAAFAETLAHIDCMAEVAY
jgi:hypothetical protein